MQETAVKICKKLQEAGFEAFFAGGAVRDLIRGIDPCDIDIATNALPHEIEEIFEKTFAIGKSFGVILIEKNNHHFEIATFRNDSGITDGRRPDAVYFTDKKEDAIRRDFTVNAIFWDPVADKIYDFVNGVNDLKKGILRFVGEPEQRIREDFLRILRAVRFKNFLDFKFGERTEKALEKHASLTSQIAAERVKTELEKMLMAKNRTKSIRDLERLGILKSVLPEVNIMRAIPQPPAQHPEGDVLEHTIHCLRHLPKEFEPEIAWAVLFHDIGKEETFTYKDRIRFPSHEHASARLVKKICNRLKFSSSEKNKIAWLVENHGKFYMIPEMTHAHKMHFFDHPFFIDLITVCRCDALGSGLSDDSLVRKIEKEYHEAYEQRLLPAFHPEFLDGREIAEILKIEPGKKIGEIKEKLRTKQIEKEINSKEEAIEWIRTNF